MLKTATENFTSAGILLISFLFVLLAAGSGAAAGTKDVSAVPVKFSTEEAYTIAARSLMKKMEADLVLSDIKVKFAKVEHYALTRSLIGIRGEGTCRLSGENHELPIHFDVKINASNRSVTEIAYNFVEAEEARETAGLSESENIVSRHLLEKIRTDFKTENIVLAIDFIQEKETSGESKNLTGEGEVRLGDLIWKKISFEIVAEGQNQSGATVRYRIHE